MLKCQVLTEKYCKNKSKNSLAENEFKKLKTFDQRYFIGKSHFEEDGTQNYVVFQPINRYFKLIANTDYVSSWKSKGLSAESIKPPNTSDNSLTPVFNYYGTKTRVKFNGSCLQQPKLSYTHGTIVNIYIVYELLALTLMIQHQKIVYLAQLLLLKMLMILISMGILVMELDLIENQAFHFQVANLVKM